MLDDALVFTQVVRAGTLTAAARQLGLPKSTVSRRIAALEDRLGARLLQRTTRKLKLTDLGDLYFARAARGVDDIRDAERSVSDAHKAVQGRLKVTVPMDFAVDRMVALFVGFCRAYPDVELAVDPTNRVVDLVGEGYDVALRAGAMTDSSLVARRLVTASRQLFASPKYLDGRGAPRTAEALRSHDVLVFAGDSNRMTLRLEGPDGVQEVDVHGRLAVADHTVLRTAAALGLGIAVLPALANECGGEGKLVRVLPEHTAGHGQLFAVYPSARHLTSKVRAFVDFAAKHFAPLDDASTPRRRTPS
jgi:DNA-binding transcriptional LysR family regulator